MVDAFLSNGVVTKPEEINYYTSKSSAAVDKLGLKAKSSAVEVRTLSLPSLMTADNGVCCGLTSNCACCCPVNVNL